MANVIPMAGLGSRFADAGYLLPKPLIPVSGVPMIVQVIRSLPASDKWIFIVSKEHIDAYRIDELIKKEIPGAIIVPEDGPRRGQAATCMLAMPHLDPEEDVFVAACDNSFLYDETRYRELAADPSVDSVMWTFTKSPLLTEKPEAWGWVKLEDDGLTIRDMSVKVPVSADPFNDHAVVATFYFKKAGDFVAAYDLMVKEGHKINGELYVDAMPIFYKKMGKRTVIFDVDLYVGWGKPKDLYLYDDWEYRVKHDMGLENQETRLWEKYFKKSQKPTPGSV